MADVAAVREIVDTWIGQWFPYFESAQEQYLAANGQYFQGLETHSVPPADGTLVAPDIGTRAPTDQSLAWRDVIPLSSDYDHEDPMPCSLSLNVYAGPDGPGWALRACVIINGITHEKTLQHGPETRQAHDWREVLDQTEEII